MTYCWILCLVLTTLSAGCGKSRDVLVAEVGPYQITSTSLRNFVEELLPGQRTQKTDEAARRHYLQILVDGRLLLMEARAHGLDTTRTVQKAVQNAVNSRVRRLYQMQEMPPLPRVSETEVQQYFEAEGFDRERLACGILVESRAQIDKVVKELQAGRPFAEVARAYSLDKRSARQDGELGFIGRNMVSQAHIPPDVFRSLPLGKVSSPLPAGRGAWHVIRFTEERPATLAQYREFIRAQLSDERRRQAEKEHLEVLRESFQVRLNSAGLQELIEAYRQKNPAALSASSTALYTHDQGQLTVAQAQEALQPLNIRRAFIDSAETVATLGGALLHPFLLERAALQAGLYENPEIRQLKEKTQEDILLEELKERAVTRQINVSEEEVRKFYDDHPKVFRVPSSVWAEELLLPTEVEAREVRQQLLDGGLFEDFVERSLRAEAQKNKAQFHFHPRDKVLYPRLLPAVMEAPLGEMVGPVEVEGGYSIFRVLGWEPERIEPYENAQRRARILLYREQETRGLKKLVKDLRKKYASKVKIYDAHLAEALPDSLVQN